MLGALSFRGEGRNYITKQMLRSKHANYA